MTEKWLLALKCLRSAHEIDPENPTLHHQTVRFKHTRKSDIFTLQEEGH